MSDRFTINQQVQMGKETVPGGTASCPILLRSVALSPAIKAEFKTHRSEGKKRADTVVLKKEWTECGLDGLATYTELGYFLASLVAKPVTTNLGSGVYQHLFASSGSKQDALQSYTLEMGSGEGCERLSFGMVQSLSFRMTRDDVHLTGTLYGRALEDGVNLTPGLNSIQAIAFSGGPTGGTFTLGFKGAWTAPLAFGATASAVQSALVGLGTIGAGNATVSAGSGGYTVTFAGALAGIRQPLLQATGAGLTGGTSPGVSVSENQKGGLTELWKIPILPGDTTVYLANEYADLGSNESKVARAFSSDWSLGDRTKPFWTQDGETGYAGVVEAEPKERLDLLLEADSVGLGLRSAYQTGQTRFIRIEMKSSTYVVGTSTIPHRLTLDAAVKVAGVKEFKDEQGLYAIGFELQMVDDPAIGHAYRLSLVNGVSGY